MNKKVLLVVILCGAMMLLQSFVQKHDDEKPTNLKILPKDISEQDLHKVMREYSMALGVHCNYCHVAEPVEGQQRPKMDFAADTKHEKKVARDMMIMVNAINTNYIGKMIGGDHPMEQVTCVTCHNGRVTPIVSTDSLMKK
jgi:hypothetical protein